MFDVEVGDDTILIFEYYTASGTDDPAIISEAEEIVRSIVLDLKDEDICVLVSKQFEHIFDDFDFDIKIIAIDDGLYEWLEMNASVFNRALFVSSENDMNLYRLTKLLESKQVKLYTSSSYAVKLASDKFETFDYLNKRVPQPKTYNILINPKTYWKRAIQLFFDGINGDYDDESGEYALPLFKRPKDVPVVDESDMDVVKEHKLIAKPRFGVDCENLKIIETKRNIDELEEIYEPGSRFVVQEFIEGDVCSVSLISNGRKALPISFNKQIVEINENGGQYVGGYIPFEHPLKEEAFKIAKKACEMLPGLQGFVGVDLIINNDEGKVYLIELNSRFTTSYVGLQKIADFNIAKSLIDLLDKKITIEDLEKMVSYDGKVSFLKDENGILDIKVEK